jgi:hypothetical protein
MSGQSFVSNILKGNSFLQTHEFDLGFLGSALQTKASPFSNIFESGKIVGADNLNQLQGP